MVFNIYFSVGFFVFFTVCAVQQGCTYVYRVRVLQGGREGGREMQPTLSKQRLRITLKRNSNAKPRSLNSIYTGMQHNTIQEPIIYINLFYFQNTYLCTHSYNYRHLPTYCCIYIHWQQPSLVEETRQQPIPPHKSRVLHRVQRYIHITQLR